MAIIDNINDLKSHNSALASGIDMENLRSFIDDAVNFQVVPAIGGAQLADLVAKKTAGELTPVQKRICDLLAKAITGFTIANYSDNGSVLIGNSGISVVRSEKTSPASDKKLMQLRRSNLKSAYAALEMAINCLEEEVGIFPIYYGSQERKRNRSRLINNSTEFQDAGVNIANDAQFFQSLKTYIDSAASTYIIPLLGEDLYDDLLANIFEHSLSVPQRKLLSKTSRALALLTMAEAIPYRAVSIDSAGVFELSETVGGISGNVENRSPASDKRLSAAMNMFTMKGEQELENLRKFLVANAADYSYPVQDDVLLNDGSAPHIYFL